jgi:hypothetical protein
MDTQEKIIAINAARIAAELPKPYCASIHIFSRIAEEAITMAAKEELPDFFWSNQERGWVDECKHIARQVAFDYPPDTSSMTEQERYIELHRRSMLPISEGGLQGAEVKEFLQLHARMHSAERETSKAEIVAFLADAYPKLNNMNWLWKAGSEEIRELKLAVLAAEEKLLNPDDRPPGRPEEIYVKPANKKKARKKALA